MPISRISARWSGFPGAPGYSNFHFQSSTSTPDAQGPADLVRAFFQEFRTFLPSGSRIDVQPTVELLDDVTGSLVDYVNVDTAPDQVIGSGSGPWPGPTGAVVNWLTSTVVNGRRLRGRTFLVPLASAAYGTDGTLSSTALDAINDGASLLSGAGFTSGFGILSRPANGGPIAFGEVTAHRVPDLAAVLRSRRD